MILLFLAVQNTFPYPILTKRIRIYPTKWERDRAALRVEFIGCKTGCLKSLGVSQDAPTNGQGRVPQISTLIGGLSPCVARTRRYSPWYGTVRETLGQGIINTVTDSQMTASSQLVGHEASKGRISYQGSYRFVENLQKSTSIVRLNSKDLGIFPLNRSQIWIVQFEELGKSFQIMN